ncbi:MAG: DUF349 domain-containing protein [Cyclobacteriaceae bacterium]
MKKKEIPFGFIADKDIYLAAYLDLPDRKIGEVKESEEESIKYFEDRFSVINEKVGQLEKDVAEAENKGSYLMKLVHLRDKIRKHDGLGDYAPLFERLDKIEASLKELIAVNRVRNEEIKRALLTEFDQFKQVTNWRNATETVLDIKNRWLKTGTAEQPQNDELESQFAELMQSFFDRKREYNEEKQKLIEIRLGKMRGIIEEMKQALRNPKANHRQLAWDFKKQWRDVGHVPRMKKSDLDREFNWKLKDLQRQRPNLTPANVSPEELAVNLAKKKDILEKVRLLEHDETEEAFHKLQSLQENWQGVGLIPKEHYKELTEEFKTLIEKALEKRFLEQLAQNKDEAYSTKNNREKTRFKIIILKDLLKRDEKDLQSFMNNMERFNRGQKFDKVMNNKLLNQKRKVVVKRQLLSELKNSLNEVTIQK